jgi:hypothetical protein
MRVGSRVPALAALSVAFTPLPAFAWGAHGHEMVSGEAVRALPAETPAFLRQPKTIARISVLGREMDRSRGAGLTHDVERDAGHFLNVDDSGKVGGAITIADLPETRAAYDAKLNEAGLDQYRQGYLPYAMIDGWQQLAKDFAYWRAAGVAMRTAKSAADRRWFREDRKLREMLIIRDLGVWSHFVGDASQPLHVTGRYDGWGAGPNAMNYQTVRGLHARFEGAFVKANIAPAEVAARIGPYRDCACTIRVRVGDYLSATHSEVMALYELEKKAAFPQPAGVPLAPGVQAPPPPPEPPSTETLAAGRAFAAARLAGGASELRDMIVMAWRESATMSVGYPAIPVAGIEGGKVILKRADFGND